MSSAARRAGLAALLAATPARAAEPVSRAPAEGLETAVAEPPLVAPAPAQPAVTPPRRRPIFGLRLGGGISAGATPATSGGLVGAAALILGRGRFELTGGWWAPRRLALGDPTSAAVNVSLATGGLRGCFEPGSGRFTLPLCLGAEFGSMRATSVGVPDARTTRSLWFALTPGASAVFVVHPRVALWLGLEGLLALARPQFEVDGHGEVWRAGSGLRATLGVELRFPARPAP